MTDKQQAQQEEVNKIFENTLKGFNLVDIDTLCDPLKCTHRTILNYIHTGKLRAVKVGAKWKVNTEEVERFLRAQIEESPTFNAPPPSGRKRGRPRKNPEQPAQN